MASTLFVRNFCKNEYSWIRAFSSSSAHRKEHYKLVVAGGGTAGTCVSNKFARKLGKGKVAVVEPRDKHFYQAMWTLVGGGLRPFERGVRPQKDVMHPNISLIQDRIGQFLPAQNSLVTTEGKEISYDFLVIALGLEVRFDKIKGCPAALDTPDVTSNFHPVYVQKTFPLIQNFKGGNAVFTFPSTPIKCAGAPQKIMYLADEHFRKNGVRDKTNITYNSALDKIFTSPAYAEALLKVIENRNITFNKKHNLVEVKPDSKEAIFDILGQDGKAVDKKSIQYDFLHIGPPCSSVKELAENKELTNADGWVTVNKQTLQHTRFANIFSLGDCSDAPTSKTAAAVSSQGGIVRKNLSAVMSNNAPQALYDGYTSCPLLTSSKTCILAEFDYTLKPKETFPFIDQRNEHRLMFHVKRDIMPRLYWWAFLPGFWEGPTKIRKWIRFGLSD